MPSAGDMRQFLGGQILETPKMPAARFDGKTVIVTGANSGLGLDCSKHLLKLGVSRLIMACRNLAKGQEARKAVIANAPQGTEPIVNVWQVDMAVTSSVIAFAERATAELDRVDAVLLNAGIDTNTFAMAENDESTLTVNVVSPFLLALALLPKLHETAAKYGVKARLSLLGSCIQIFAPDDQLKAPDGQIFSTLSDKSKADMSQRYYLSKLMVGLCTRALAERVDAKQVVVNYVNPGWCRTNLFREDYNGVGAKIGLSLIGRTSEEGSRTLVHAIDAGPETHGCYLSECKIKKPSAFMLSAQGEKVQTRLCSELLAKLEACSPGVSRGLAQKASQ